MIAIVLKLIVALSLFELVLQLALEQFELPAVLVELLLARELVLHLVDVLLVQIFVKHVQIVTLRLMQHLLQLVVTLTRTRVALPRSSLEPE